MHPKPMTTQEPPITRTATATRSCDMTAAASRPARMMRKPTARTCWRSSRTKSRGSIRLMKTAPGALAAAAKQRLIRHGTKSRNAALRSVSPGGLSPLCVVPTRYDFGEQMPARSDGPSAQSR